LATYPNANHLFQYLIDHASYKDKDASFRYQCVHLQKGDVLVGLRSMKKRTGLSVRTIRTCLNYLKSTQRVTIKTTHRFSIVSIVKWDTYQGSDSDSDTLNDTLSDKQPTQRRQHTRSKELKKDQNPVAVALFDFYSENIISVPAKRSDAIKNITKLLNSGHTKEDLAGAVEDYANSNFGDKPFHPNNFFGQKEYYKGYGKYAK
jgi:hypothetical protein